MPNFYVQYPRIFCLNIPYHINFSPKYPVSLQFFTQISRIPKTLKKVVQTNPARTKCVYSNSWIFDSCHRIASLRTGSPREKKNEKKARRKFSPSLHFFSCGEPARKLPHSLRCSRTKPRTIPGFSLAAGQNPQARHSIPGMELAATEKEGPII